MMHALSCGSADPGVTGPGQRPDLYSRFSNTLELRW